MVWGAGGAGALFGTQFSTLSGKVGCIPSANATSAGDDAFDLKKLPQLALRGLVPPWDGHASNGPRFRPRPSPAPRKTSPGVGKWRVVIRGGSCKTSTNGRHPKTTANIAKIALVSNSPVLLHFCLRGAPPNDSMEAPTPLEDLVPFTAANWGSFHLSLRE